MDYSRHLLIDAYNVIYKWPKLRRLLKQGSGPARDALASMVQILHDHEKIRVTLVFDGQGDEVQIERPGELLTFSYLFSAKSLSADDVIEQLVGRTEDPATCLVVTGDLAERHTVEALGASALSPDDLLAWIAVTEETLATKIRLHRKSLDSVWKNRMEF